MLLDDSGILGYLNELDEEAKAIRKEIAQMVMALEGRVSWTECWNMSREDRLNIAEAFDALQKQIKQSMRK